MNHSSVIRHKTLQNENSSYVNDYLKISNNVPVKTFKIKNKGQKESSIINNPMNNSSTFANGLRKSGQGFAALFRSHDGIEALYSSEALAKEDWWLGENFNSLKSSSRFN
jgi:hypothetical protein